MKPFYDIPIFFLNYTRPHNSKIISEVLQTLNPVRFYISSDFPPENEKFFKRMFDVKSSLTHFKKNSNVVHIPSTNIHKGSFLTTMEAMDYVFKVEEELIFLLNDTIPNLEFFKFVQQTKHLLDKEPDLKTIIGFNLLKNPRSGYFKTIFNLPCWGFYFQKKSYLEFLDYINNDLQSFDFSKILNYFSKEDSPIVEYYCKNTQQLALNKSYERLDLDTLILMYNIQHDTKTLVPGTSFVKYNGFDDEARNIDIKPYNPSLFNFDFQGDFVDLYFEDKEYEKSLISNFFKLHRPKYLRDRKLV